MSHSSGTGAVAVDSKVALNHVNRVLSGRHNGPRVTEGDGENHQRLDKSQGKGRSLRRRMKTVNADINSCGAEECKGRLLDACSVTSAQQNLPEESAVELCEGKNGFV